MSLTLLERFDATWDSFLDLKTTHPVLFRVVENVFFYQFFATVLGVFVCSCIVLHDGRDLVRYAIQEIGRIAFFLIQLAFLPFQRPLPKVVRFSKEDFFKLVVGYFLAEFLYYFFHRLNHEIEWLWFNAHLGHHIMDDTKQPFQCEWATLGYPLELFTVFIWAEAPKILLVHPILLWIVEPVSTVMGYFEHSSTVQDPRTRDMWFLNADDHHLWHHNSTLDSTVNFGARLKIFDQLFGTHYNE